MTTNNKKKKKREFPNAVTVLFLVLILAVILTYFVPAGLYQRLSYNADANTFEITHQDGSITEEEASDKTLDKLGISISFDKFKNGDIKKPISIPNTYEKIEQHPQGIGAFLTSPINGVIDTADIMIFILMIGGNIGLLNKSGAFDAGIAALSKKTKGKEFILIIIVFILITLGGTTFGMAEETIALYPILMPVFLASGYDAMVAIGTIYIASSLGTMFSTTNPFATIIASNAAGINFKLGLTVRVVALVIGAALSLVYVLRYARSVKLNPETSILADEMPEIRNKFEMDKMAEREVPEFTLKRKLILFTFFMGFPVLVWGDCTQGWWFGEMSAIFMVTAFIIMLLSELPENEAINTFMSGAADLIQVALVCGLARAINIIMDNGMISDTMLFYTSRLVEGMNGVLFSIIQMILFTILGIFIPSSSGLAVLSMPIFAPLADTVGLGRDVIVTAYSLGQGWMAFLTPTGLILPTLQIAGGVSFNKWVKWIMPYMLLLAVYAALVLAVETII